MSLAALGLVVGCAEGNIGQNTLTDAAKKTRIESMYEEYHREFPDVGEIDSAGLMALQAKGPVVIVDVREPEERAVSTIPGAIDKVTFEKHLEEYRGTPTVVHCTIGYRSGLYVEELKGKGLDALNLKGSIVAWAHEGGKVVDRAGQETKRVHVYGKRWALLPDGWTAVY